MNKETNDEWIYPIEMAKELTKWSSQYCKQKLKFYNRMIQQMAKKGKDFIEVKYDPDDDFIYDKMKTVGYKVLKTEDNLIRISWQDSDS